MGRVCKKRKFTRGGALLIGQCIALPSAGAKLYAAKRGIREAKWLNFLGQEFGQDLRIVAWGDAKATVGLCFRRGLGRARHIETVELWIHYVFGRGECELGKVNGERKLADLLTKPGSRDVLARHLERLGWQPVQPGNDPRGG